MVPQVFLSHWASCGEYQIIIIIIIIIITIIIIVNIIITYSSIVDLCAILKKRSHGVTENVDYGLYGLLIYQKRLDHDNGPRLWWTCRTPGTSVVG